MAAFRTRRTATAACVAVAVAALAGCASNPTSSSNNNSSSSTLTAYLYQDPKLFSPLEAGNGPDEIVMNLVFDSLLGEDKNFQLQPHLAAAEPAVTSSGGGTRFTFHLRPGLKWSDGKPFTSADVLYTYNLLANPASTNPVASNYSPVAGWSSYKSGAASIAGFSAPNPTTFVIRTSTPDSGLMSLIGNVPILPKHILGKLPVAQVAKSGFFQNPTVGLGPYDFVTYQTDQYVELKANPDYRTHVNIGKVFLKPVTSDVATAQLGTGEMDMVQIEPTDLPTAEKMKGIKIASSVSPGYVRIAVNQKQARFADPRVRQALLYAVDRKKIVQAVLAGQGTVVNTSFFGQAIPGNINTYPYDPAKAEQLLKSAGWDSSKRVTLEWIPGQSDRDTAVTIVQSELKAVGVDVVLKQVQATQLLQDYTSNFDMALYGGGVYATDPSQTPPIISCDQQYPDGPNIPRFCDQQLDAYTAQANKDVNQSARMALYRKAALLDNQQAPYLWLYNPDTIWAYTSKLKGFDGSGDITNPFIGIANWSIS